MSNISIIGSKDGPTVDERELDTFLAGRGIGALPERLSVEALTATYRLKTEGELSFLDPAIGGKNDGVSDNVAAWNIAMTLMAGKGGTLFFPQGIYCFASEPNDVPGGVRLRGTGYNYSDPTTYAPRHNSVLRATAAMNRFVKLSASGSGGQSLDAYTGTSMDDLVVDGRHLANNVVTTNGRRNKIRNCQVYWGAVRGIEVQGQNTYIVGGVVNQGYVGDCITIFQGGDHKIFDAEQREAGPGGACIRVSGTTIADVMIRGNHMYGTIPDGSDVEAMIVIDSQAVALPNISIHGNVIENTRGPEIKITGTSAGSIRSLLINSNMFFNQNSSTNHPVISFDHPGSVSSVSINGNIMEGKDASNLYKSIIDFKQYPTTTTKWSVIGNVGTYIANIVTPTSGAPVNRLNLSNNAIRNATANAYSNRRDVAALNGGTTTYTIAHELDSTPRAYSVTAQSQSATQVGGFTVSVDAANLTVTYATAPPSGTGNVKFAWWADR
jgi:hypothetical protein